MTPRPGKRRARARATAAPATSSGGDKGKGSPGRGNKSKGKGKGQSDGCTCGQGNDSLAAYYDFFFLPHHLAPLYYDSRTRGTPAPDGNGTSIPDPASPPGVEGLICGGRPSAAP